MEKGREVGYIHSACSICLGSGKVISVHTQYGTKYIPWKPGDEGDPINCPSGDCNAGDMSRYSFRVRMMKDVVFSWQIFELTEQSEYEDLTGNDKKLYDYLMQMGIFSIGENTKARQILSSLFPAGSITRDKLLEFVEE